MLEVGRITKPHGLRGEVLVKLSTTETTRLDAGSTLYATDRRLVVLESRTMQDRWIVHFEGVDDRQTAEELRGEVLVGEPGHDSGDDPEALWVHELVGAEVVDRSGRSHGRVETVQANPASDLLVLESGALVPLTFVVGWLARGERLEIDPPVGLFDL